MHFFRGKTINCALKWISFTYWLTGTIICTTLFLLSRMTHVKIFEDEQNLFNKSPNLSKIGAIKSTNEVPTNEVPNNEPAKENNGLKTVNENEVVANELDMNGVPRTGAVLLLNEIVTKAASAANNSRLQKDFNSIKF